MSARSIRRAAERYALKTTSAVQVAANQANAQRSTGPRTEEGQAVSSLNALKTGLTGRSVFLPTDNAAEYQSHLLAYRNELNPIGALECDLAKSVADSLWRLRRISSLEKTIFYKGSLEFSELFVEADPEYRAALIQLHTYETYEKQLRNLHIQEARLSRRREKELAELRRLQQERIQKENAAAEQAAKPVAPAANGFEFSTAPAAREMPQSTPPPVASTDAEAALSAAA